MTGHATTIDRRHAAATPADALAAFIRIGRRETLIGELARSWHKLGRAEVEEAVDAAIADATTGMHATREAAVYEYLRTAAQRRLGRRKERAERTSAALPDGMDFDCVVGDSLSPEELLLAKEHRAVVLDLVSGLDDRTLAVMRLKHIEGLERKQVAEVLGISEKAVKKAIERGHRECRESFDAAMGGQLCSERTTALVAFARGSASPRQRRQAEQHLRHCAACREQQRSVMVAQRAVAALVPAPIVGAPRVSGLLSRCADWISGLMPTSATATPEIAGTAVSGASKTVALVVAAVLASGGAYGATQPRWDGDGARSPQARTRVAPPAEAPVVSPPTAQRSAAGPRPNVRSPRRRATRTLQKRATRDTTSLQTGSGRTATTPSTATPFAPSPTGIPASSPSTTSQPPASDEFPIF